MTVIKRFSGFSSPSRDIHKLVEGRNLLLGGVKIPYHLGELAHSDGDVLYHALAESILGALALGDLGKHFPDTSDETLNMDSSIILRKCYGFAKDRGYHVVNVDISITLERPKLKDYIPKMKYNVSFELDIHRRGNIFCRERIFILTTRS